jgi:hypothetical protein
MILLAKRVWYNPRKKIAKFEAWDSRGSNWIVIVRAKHIRGLHLMHVKDVCYLLNTETLEVSCVPPIKVTKKMIREVFAQVAECVI